MNARVVAQVFVDDLERLTLTADDRHHLERVLRLRPGERVVAADGRGGWRSTAVAPGPFGLVADGDVVVDPSPAPPVTVAFALTKGDKPELVVQKLTEVGVDRIVPFVAGRSVVRWDGDKAARALDRLRAVAREAAMQCRRVRLPVVEAVRPFAAVVDDLMATACLAEIGVADPPDLRRPALLVGPEGGWTPEERDCGLPAVGLGPTVLRAETAALVGGYLFCALRSGTVRGRDGSIGLDGAREG